MAYLYFDESIREKGGFIIGALVVSDDNLSIAVQKQWLAMGLDPEINEYKSHEIKERNDISIKQRNVIKSLIMYRKLALVVLPIDERDLLGNYCADLVLQLMNTKMLCDDSCQLYLDENISMGKKQLEMLRKKILTVF